MSSALDMPGQVIGYVRVSSTEQNPDREGAALGTVNEMSNVVTSPSNSRSRSWYSACGSSLIPEPWRRSLRPGQPVLDGLSRAAFTQSEMPAHNRVQKAGTSPWAPTLA